MGEQSLKTRLTAYTGEFMAALLLIQPLLDVLSYFMQEHGSTVVIPLCARRFFLW